MSDSIDKLKAEAVNKALESGKLEDIERAASVCKLAAEAQKGSADALTQRSVVRHEGLKNWGLILVPLLSVLTLGVTIYNQTGQQRDTQKSRDDLAWRNAIEEFKSASSNKVPVGGLLAQVRLKPFFKSSVYGPQANQLARLILPRIGDPDAFEDLFESVEWQDPNEMLRVNRNVNEVYDDVSKRLSMLKSSQGAQVERPIARQPGTPPGYQEQLEHDQLMFFKRLSYVCNKLADASRSRTFKSTTLNLEGAYLPDCDLSRMDFSNATLTNAGFQNVNLENARFANITKFDNVTFFNTAWWKASEIGAPLLTYLMETSDPASDTEKDLPGKPTKDQYITRVMQLCKGANIACPESSIKFTVPVPENK